ncbi:DNA replication/repair protein RecF, partial [Anaerostipes sp.]|uniref:DNA replication/repair protein RecF n=1 Tax=Anaerostipes sp. TaxID=1872530 RepID=UPI003FF1151E
MFIKSLELKNYRNYEQLSMNFAGGTNLLYGDNAQGKTNIVEAIYLAATTKSHRGSKDREIIQFHHDEAHIRIHYEKQDIMHQLDMHLKKNRAKGVAIDRIPIRKSSDLLGQIPVIFFSPEDLKIIKNGPSERRKFLDIELSQLERLYLYHLTKYNK